MSVEPNNESSSAEMNEAGVEGAYVRGGRYHY